MHSVCTQAQSISSLLLGLLVATGKFRYYIEPIKLVTLFMHTLVFVQLMYNALVNTFTTKKTANSEMYVPRFTGKNDWRQVNEILKGNIAIGIT